MKHLSFSLISIYSLNIAYKFYLEQELDINELYRTCNFKLKDLQDENKEITVETFLNSLRLIQKHLKNEQKLSIVLDKHLSFSDFGGFGFTLLAAPSLKEGLDLVIQGFSIMDPSFEFKRVKINSSSFRFTVENPGNFKEFNDDILDLSLLMLKKYIRCFIGYKENIDIENNLAKNKNSRSIIIENYLLELPSIMSHPAFFNSNKVRIIKKAQQYKKYQGCVLSVNKIIRHHINNGYKPSLTDISQHLGTTNKTLSRLLNSHNTSFQACLDQVLCDLAIKLVEEDYNTKEIAYTLGFQSIAGLNYLFIKKYGLTLNQLKKSLNLSR